MKRTDALEPTAPMLNHVCRATLLALLCSACADSTPPAEHGFSQPNDAGDSGSAAGSQASAGASGQVQGLVPPRAGTGAAGSAGISAAISGSGGQLAGNAGTSAAGISASGAGHGGAPAANGGSGGAGSPGACPEPPAGTDAASVAAVDAVNALRIASGSGCATFVQAIADGAAKHCAYYAANASDQMCIADPHSEVMGCTGFTGVNFGDRIKATGYTGSPAFEVMAFLDDPNRAVSTWVNSVWHRIPVLSPWVTELGYGAATRCDTIDFGRGKPLPDTTIVVYPYDMETDIPVSFDGSREGPMPPTPSTGKWPSGPPISLYAKKLSVTAHTLTKDGDTTPITHTWLDAATASSMFKGFLTDVAFMYSDSPLTAATKYRVHITGTSDSGPLDREWTFTTH